MAHHREVFRTEDGEYLTIPDGDPATQEEILEYLVELSPAFRRLIEHI